jgi:hypothetical protein
MSLSDRLKDLNANRRPNSIYCAYIVMYQNLSPTDQKALDEAWAEGHSAHTILSALRAEGIKASNESIRAHRQGFCKCPKN